MKSRSVKTGAKVLRSPLWRMDQSEVRRSARGE